MPFDPALDHAFTTTWPAAEYRQIGGFSIGRGEGGGGRISSARLTGEAFSEADIDAVARQHAEWQQEPLFQLWPGQEALAAALGARGYRGARPTLVYEIAVDRLCEVEVPPITVFPIWPPLAIQQMIWEEGHITPARQAAMMRVDLPRISLLGRLEDHASASAFLAVDGEVAMIHAIEVEEKMRRKGMAEFLLRRAGFWARDHGATRLALAVTAENAPATALYHKLGFTEVARYDYWSPAAAT